MEKTIRKTGRIAYDILWDTDGDEEVSESLPKVMFIPDGIPQEPGDYITDLAEFCHFGFSTLKVVFDRDPRDFKKGSLILFLGESGSGKTTVQRELEKRGVKKVVTYTTRPMREGETDGVDYHFITEERFREMVDNGEFAEHASYRGWHYGTAVADCSDPNRIIAVTPAGFRELKKVFKERDIPFVSVYLNVDRRTRLVSILSRGDDIEEAYRRSLSDLGQFDGVENEVNCMIVNENHSADAETIAEVMLDIIGGDMA